MKMISDALTYQKPMSKIFYGPKIEEKIKKILADGPNQLHVLADFDRTITLPSSSTSWATFTASKLLPEVYAKKRNELFDFYHPFEIDPKLDLPTKRLKMAEWWRKHLELIMEYKPTLAHFQEISRDKNFFSLRPGTDHVLRLLSEMEIPVIIVSAGIGNFIQLFLEANGLLFSNIHIVSNIFTFDADGIVNGISDPENLVHVANKNERALPDNLQNLLHNRNNALILGDTLEDLQMADLTEKELLLSVGFLERNPEEYRQIFREKFDLVLEDQQPMDEVLKIIRQF